MLGYTDNIGDEESNIQLSEERAGSVTQYLINKGINKDRISYKGYGSKNPITNNDTEQEKEKNRRVEFILTDN